jgi:LysR family transcriptional regulator, pca operon transcriptional activator
MARYLEQRLKLRHLRVIDMVARHKSLLRAAGALGVSQPALSRSLQEIEDIVGFEIFERHARGVRENQVGAILVELARTVLGQVRRAEDALEAHAASGVPAIVIGALPVAASGLMPAVLTQMYQTHPDIKVRLVQGRTEDLIPLLLSDEIDLIVGRLYSKEIDDGLIREVLYDEPISIIARSDHPVLEKDAMSPNDLSSYRLILPTITQRVERDIQTIIEQIGLTPDRSLRSSSLNFTRELLLTTDFITAAPRMLVAGDLARRVFRILPIELPDHSRPGGIIYRSNMMTADMSRLVAAIQAELKKLAHAKIVRVVP